MIDGKKYKIILGTKLKSGDFITYDGASLCGYGIADTEDLHYINEELDVCLNFGNVFNNTVDIDGVVDELINNGSIGGDDIERTRFDIEKEINEFLIN